MQTDGGGQTLEKNPSANINPPPQYSFHVVYYNIVYWEYLTLVGWGSSIRGSGKVGVPIFK